MPYTRVREIGRGQFGVVRLEHDVGLGRDCAAKELDPTYLVPGHEFDEARRMIDVEDDHVVRLYSADIESGKPIIRMEYLPDGSVEKRFHGEPAPVLEATLVVEDACRGVEALHAGNVLHRDIKPANLLYGSKGVKVSDFGLACVKGNPAAGAMFGYVQHLPPEALSGKGVIEDVRGDVYALGVTAYRLYNGDAMLNSALPPGTNDPTSLIIAGKFPDTTKMQPHIHKSLRKVIAKALHIDPTKRFQTAAALRHALEKSRPTVSWDPGPAGSDTWSGSTPDPDGRRFHAEIVRSGSVAEFRVQKQARPNGPFRHITADGLTGTHDAVETHAASVLQRYAEKGV